MLFALVVGLFLPFASFAQDVIAVVDMQQVMDGSVAIEKVQEQIKKKYKSFQEEVQKKEESLREEEKKLIEQRSLLAKEAYQEKEKDLLKKINQVNRDLQEKRIQDGKKVKEAEQEVKEAIAAIVKNLASEKKFNLAIPSAVALYYDIKLDITKEVISRLNKELPKVKTKL